MLTNPENNNAKGLLWNQNLCHTSGLIWWSCVIRGNQLFSNLNFLFSDYTTRQYPAGKWAFVLTRRTRDEVPVERVRVRTREECVHKQRVVYMERVHTKYVYNGHNVFHWRSLYRVFLSLLSFLQTSTSAVMAVTVATSLQIAPTPLDLTRVHASRASLTYLTLVKVCTPLLLAYGRRWKPDGGGGGGGREEKKDMSPIGLP